MTPWTTEQVTGLAPDGASVAAGRKLAAPGPWSATGFDERAVWGLAKGSGKTPYQAAVDLSGPAYTCSCPSRKIPCKHVLGLLLLWSAGEVHAGTPEPFAAEWLERRDGRAEASKERAAAREATPVDTVAQERRRARRAELVSAGCDELGRWLEDLVRQGLAAARERPASSWDTAARRLVDAQAPGLVPGVRRLEAAVLGGGPDWPRAALREAGRLAVRTAAWGRSEAQPEDLAADLRAAVGWSPRADDVRGKGAAERGPWAVAGVRVVAEERLRVRRTWLVRTTDRRPAVLLDHAPVGGGFSGVDHVVGTLTHGTVHPYPGRAGLRVLVGDDLAAGGPWDGPDDAATIDAALDLWSAALGRDPSCERLGVALHGVVPVRDGGRWWLRDPAGDALALPDGAVPRILALSGGAPLALTAEWDGHEIDPLCVWLDDGTAVPFSAAGAVR